MECIGKIAIRRKCITLARSFICMPAVIFVLGNASAANERSIHSDVPVEVLFRNETERPVEIYWVDFAGNEKHYGTLQPRAQYAQPTYATHPWRFRQGGRVVGSFTPTTNANQKYTVTMAAAQRPYAIDERIAPGQEVPPDPYADLAAESLHLLDTVVRKRMQSEVVYAFSEWAKTRIEQGDHAALRFNAGFLLRQPAFVRPDEQTASNDKLSSLVEELNSLNELAIAMASGSAKLVTVKQQIKPGDRLVEFAIDGRGGGVVYGSSGWNKRLPGRILVSSGKSTVKVTAGSTDYELDIELVGDELRIITARFELDSCLNAIPATTEGIRKLALAPIGIDDCQDRNSGHSIS